MHGNSGMKNWGRVHGCSTLPRVATDGCIAARAMNTVMRTMGLLDGAISSIWLEAEGYLSLERVVCYEELGRRSAISHFIGRRRVVCMICLRLFGSNKQNNR
jgi:hypothetical protein